MSTLNGGPGNIVTNGLVLYLDAANYLSYTSGSTVWRDLSSNNLSGSLINGPTFDSGNAGSIVFDGVNDYGTIDSYYPVFTGDFAINIWAKFTAYIDYQNIISSMDSGFGNQGFWLEFGNARGFTLYSGPPKATLVLEDNLISLTSLSTNVWYNFCVSRIGTGTNNIKLYVNNVVCGQNTSNAVVGSSLQNLQIARYGKDNLNNLFKGNIANISIYNNKGLTASEILQNYNATKARFGL